MEWTWGTSLERMVDVPVILGFVAIEPRFLDCGPIKAIGPSLGMTDFGKCERVVADVRSVELRLMM